MSEAEVEAVARAIAAEGQASNPGRLAEVAIAALDAVRRSPQGEDHAERRKALVEVIKWVRDFNDLHGEGVYWTDIEREFSSWIDPRTCLHPEVRGGFCRRCGLVMSPQGEDHEALREQVARQAATIAWYRKRFGDTGRGAASTDSAYRRAQGEDHEAVEKRVREVMASPSYAMASDEERARWITNHVLPYLSRCLSPERDTEKLVEVLREIRDYQGDPHLARGIAREALAEFDTPKEER